MELALIIIAGIGILLFALSYLSYLFTGFKHHFVTGIIAALPVLNVVTLPALWHKAGKKFVTGFLGLIIFGASWHFGADKGIKNLVSSINGNSEKVITSTSNAAPSSMIPLSLPNANDQTNSTQKILSNNNPKPAQNIKHPFIDDDKLLSLPSKALYKLTFETVPLESIATLNNRIVRIKTENGVTREGRILTITSNMVLINAGLDEQEIPIANILQLQLMVKK